MTHEPVERDPPPPLPPLNREQYRRAIEIFMVELNHICSNVEDADLRSLPRFSGIISEYLADFRDTSADATLILRTAFAFVDEYCGANEEAVISAAHEAYLIAMAQSGETSS
jgi:hypothetical protein